MPNCRYRRRALDDFRSLLNIIVSAVLNYIVKMYVQYHTSPHILLDKNYSSKKKNLGMKKP